MRDVRIQSLRGFAVLLVVLLHALKVVDAHGGTMIAAMFANDNFGAMGVDLFFVLSGAMMAGTLRRGPTPSAFLRSRAIRLLPMWWLAATAFLAMAIVLPIEASVESVLNTLTILPLLDRGRYDLPIPGVGWTLGFEILFYLLIAAALLLPARRRMAAVLWGLALLVALGMVMPPSSPLGGFARNTIHAEFALGMLAACCARRRWAARLAPLLAAGGIVALGGTILFGFSFATDQWSVVEGRTGLVRTLVWGLPSALLLAGATARPAPSTARGPLAALGDASYAIYLVHTAFCVAVPFLWPWWGPAARVALVAGLVPCGIGAGIIVHRLIERPLLARLRRQASLAASASTVRPCSLTSANPPSTWMRAETVLAPE